MIWTAEQDAAIHAGWGKKFARAIAIELGVTKNAVIGRAKRLGMPKVFRQPECPKVIRERRITRPIEAPVYAGAFNIPFLDRERNQCVFPTEGEGCKMLVCGLQTHDQPYCPHHCSIAYEAPRGPKTYAWNGR
jgi:GcrA cell cycle regulator